MGLSADWVALTLAVLPHELQPVDSAESTVCLVGHQQTESLIAGFICGKVLILLLRRKK
jgi:hypothetical protein